MKIKIKDKIILGSISAILAALIFNLIGFISSILHLNKWHLWQIAASLYFPQEKLHTIPAIIIGGATHLTLVGIEGIALFYILYYTGRSFYIIKGMGIGLITWIIMFGGLLSLKITSITQPVGAQTNMYFLFSHLLGGILISILMVKLADDDVWD